MWWVSPVGELGSGLLETKLIIEMRLLVNLLLVLLVVDVLRVQGRF